MAIRTSKYKENASEEFMEIGKEVVPGMRLHTICCGHAETIGRIVWSPCGKFIASPSRDQTIRIWDADNGKCLSVLEGYDTPHGVLTWSPDSNCIAFGGVNSDKIKAKLRIWNITNPQCQAILETHNQSVASIDWSPDGTMIAAGFYPRRNAPNTLDILIWDVGTKKLVSRLEGFSSGAVSIKWSPDGNNLASFSYGQMKIWNVQTWRCIQSRGSVVGGSARRDCVWFNSNKLIYAESRNLIVFDLEEGRETNCLEGHSITIDVLETSHDNSLLVSESTDSIRFWTTSDWRCIRILKKPLPYTKLGIGFTHSSFMLAMRPANRHSIWISACDINTFFSKYNFSGQTLSYISAKIVLVGESNVGKSCLAMRLAEDRYPNDHEHGSTHGMRFWPMAAEKLHASAQPPEGQRRDVVLWDFGGQDEYQLVHQMFLQDTTLALVLIDPTRGKKALDEGRDWNKRLEKHLGKGRAVKLLVGAKVDEKTELIDQNGIDALCKECGFTAFIDLSAKTGRNTQKLRELISSLLDWDKMAKTSRPKLFQHIRDDVERRRKENEIVLTLEEFKEAIKQSAAEMYTEAAVDAVSDQLATQGIIVRTKLTGGDDALVFQLPVIEQYAGSLIIAARNNPRGVPVLEERLLGSIKSIPLPGMEGNERLEPQQERMVLECIVELMIQYGICFRHGGLLVFPTLFPADNGKEEKLLHSVSLYYDFTGAIDNIYASLVSSLMVSEAFGVGRLEAGRVEFDRPNKGICGIRQIKRKGGFAHIDLFYDDETEQKVRNLFTGFVEEHLRLNGVDIREHQAIKCQCGKVIDEDDVQANIDAGQADVICPRCRRTTLISEGVSQIQKRDPESGARILALRKRIEEQTASDIAIAKGAVAGNKQLAIWQGKRDYLLKEEAIASDASKKFTIRKELEECEKRIAELSTTQSEPDVRISITENPIRVLHLSDLHFEESTSPKASLQWLLQDLQNDTPNFPTIKSVEYLVLSGDVTHRGDDAGFDVARQFVGDLIDELGLSSLRCIFVPGNHDIQRLDSCYRYQSSAPKLDKKMFVKSAEHIYLVRDEADYPNRLKQFSNAFYHKVTSSIEYPLAPQNQGMSYFFEDTGVQFLALNTAWEIDQFHPNRSGVYPEALANAISSGDKQVRDAIERRDFKKTHPRLRIAVFHHAIHGPWAMQNIGFVENLQTAGVRLCLHGDVHEMRRQWINHWDEDRSMHVIGAGTFGSKRDQITEGSARSYNLIEIAPDLTNARVYVREQPKPDGAWRGWNHFPDPDGGRGQVPFFDIDFS